MRFLRSSWLNFSYYFFWLWFGLGGLSLNFVCTPFLLFPRRQRFGPKVRATIRWLLDRWLKCVHATDVVKISYHGFTPESIRPGTVYVANHPSLIDAPVILAQLRDTFCIFKPALLRNPFIAPAAILAGYSAGDAGVDLIRDAAEKVADGLSLLVFPEGTRTTPGQRLNPFKPGFALIAQRAQAPIRLISVRASPGLVPRGRSWWKVPPQLPASLEVFMEDELPADFEGSPAEITAWIEDRLGNLVSMVAPLDR